MKTKSQFHLSSPDWGTFTGFAPEEEKVIRASHATAQALANHASWFGAWESKEMETEYQNTIDAKRKELNESFEKLSPEGKQALRKYLR